MDKKLTPSLPTRNILPRNNGSKQPLLVPLLLSILILATVLVSHHHHSRTQVITETTKLIDLSRISKEPLISLKPSVSSSVPLVQAILVTGVDSDDHGRIDADSVKKYVDQMSKTTEFESEKGLRSSTESTRNVNSDEKKSPSVSNLPPSDSESSTKLLKKDDDTTEKPVRPVTSEKQLLEERTEEIETSDSIANTAPSAHELDSVVDVKLSETGHSLKEYLKALTIQQLRKNGDVNADAAAKIQNIISPFQTNSVSESGAKGTKESAASRISEKERKVEVQKTESVTQIDEVVSVAKPAADMKSGIQEKQSTEKTNIDIQGKMSKQVKNELANFQSSSKKRVPPNYQRYTNSLFDHPKVKEAFDSMSKSLKDTAMNQCFGPDNNIDVYINEDLIQSDMEGPLNGYTVFCLDCRDSEAFPLIAFIVVLDKHGSIVNIHNPGSRAESVVMYDTDHVLFSTIGNNGVVSLWNWKDDRITVLPFEADAHTVQYAQKQGIFYGLDKDTKKNSPSVAHAYDKKGNVIWSYSQPYSHINWMTVEGDYVFLSLRSDSSVVQLNRKTGKMERIIGGKYSTVKIVNHKGESYDSKNWHSKEDFSFWNHQHKFQYLDDNFYSLFDNHVGSTHEFIDGENSRMVILQIDPNTETAYEIFSHDTGDKAHIYGSADLLPSGNILGNSYHYIVDPLDDDRLYHANIWEVTADDQIAMRIGFKGLNPFEPKDLDSPHPHAVTLTDEPPVGWVIFNVERFYKEPQMSKPCRGDGYVQIFPFNTIRTQERTSGVVSLKDAETNSVLRSMSFEFHRSWLPEALRVPIMVSEWKKNLILSLSNQWNDVKTVGLGQAANLALCTQIHQTDHHRIVKN